MLYFLILSHNLSGAYIICIAFILMTLYKKFKISPAFFGSNNPRENIALWNFVEKTQWKSHNLITIRSQRKHQLKIAKAEASPLSSSSLLLDSAIAYHVSLNFNINIIIIVEWGLSKHPCSKKLLLHIINSVSSALLLLHSQSDKNCYRS